MTGSASTRLTVIDYEPIPNVTPEQAERAMRRIAEHARDADDARGLLDVVFGKARRRPPRGFKGRSPRDETGLKPCGTEAAYRRHKTRGEDACGPCLAAANEARAESQRRVRDRRKAEEEMAK